MATHATTHQTKSGSDETATKPASSNENLLAAIAYVFGWVSGLIVLLTSKPEEKFKRWHAIQAIGLGVVGTLFYVIFTWVLAGMVFSSAASYAMWSMVAMLVNLVIFVAWVVMAVTAYQGKKVRLPVLADMADKNA